MENCKHRFLIDITNLPDLTGCTRKRTSTGYVLSFPFVLEDNTVVTWIIDGNIATVEIPPNSNFTPPTWVTREVK